MRRELSSLTQELRAAASDQLAEALLRSQPWTTSDTVLGFYGQSSEPETRRVLQSALDQGRVLALPRVAGERLAFHRVADLGLLQPGYRGVAEPVDDTPLLGRAMMANALVLVPGLAFDASGRRLGRGGGYYDRWLAALRSDAERCRFVGVCFHRQLVEQVPEHTHDQRVDQVLTERGWLAGPKGREYDGGER